MLTRFTRSGGRTWLTARCAHTITHTITTTTTGCWICGRYVPLRTRRTTAAPPRRSTGATLVRRYTRPSGRATNSLPAPLLHPPSCPSCPCRLPDHLLHAHSRPPSPSCPCRLPDHLLHAHARPPAYSLISQLSAHSYDPHPHPLPPRLPARP